MSKTINIGQPLFNNIEGHPFVLGPQGPYRTKEEAIQALIKFYETRNDIPNGQECMIAGVKFIWRGDDLYESLAVKTINEGLTDLNFYRTTGVYRFNSIRNNNFANLPINNNNQNASITGELVVYSSVEGTTTYRSIIGQTLFLSNAEGHETKIYTRSANKTSNDGGVTYEVTWGDWQVCQGMKEVGVVNSYDSFIDNGMYSGVYNNNGIIETFVVITINDYAIKSQLGAPKSISQLKYALNAQTSKNELSIRVGKGEPLTWDEWKPVFDDKHITAQLTNIQKQLNELAEGITGNINDTVNKAVSDLVGGAPEAYDTLKEIVDYVNKNKDEVTGQVTDIVTSLNELQNLKIMDLGSNLRPDQATNNIITYVRDNNIKYAVLFKYIDPDNSSTLGICISRMNGNGWFIYLIARKGIERLQFNSRGSREAWNEYGGILRHQQNAVSDGLLETMSVNGLKSLIVDNLNANETLDNTKKILSILSANQGRILNEKIKDNKNLIEALEEPIEELQKTELKLSVLDNGNIVLSNNNGDSREFMPATPSGDPMHWAYVSAGAEYNNSDNFIVKDTPWKDLVDPINYKAQWNLDIVDASLVQADSIVYDSKSYRYAKDIRTSPVDKSSQPRYRVVTQSGDKWVWDDTKVLHLPNHWYLNGLGDITNEEIREIYRIEKKDMSSGISMLYWRQNTLRTATARQGSYGVQQTGYAFAHNTSVEVANFDTLARYDADLVSSKVRHLTSFTDRLTLAYMTKSVSISTFSVDTLVTAQLHQLKTSINMGNSPLLSRATVLRLISTVVSTITTPITITLHADAYARLVDDADIVAALNAKNTALEGSGGSISLVSA